MRCLQVDGLSIMMGETQPASICRLPFTSSAVLYKNFNELFKKTT